MPMEGVRKPTAKPSAARGEGEAPKLKSRGTLLGERSESLSGEARPALPVEGVLNPINCVRKPAAKPSAARVRGRLQSLRAVGRF